MLVLVGHAWLSHAQITNVNTGTGANTGTGDPLRTAYIKINSNTVYLATQATNVLTGKSLWVDAVNGSDTTGARGNAKLPFLTINAAKAAASAGDTIFVLPGTYTEFNILTNGVNYYFHAGASVVKYLSTTNDPANDWGIIDDRTTGATTNLIGGYGSFALIGYTGTVGTISQRINSNSFGTVTITNTLSRISLKAREIGRSKFLDSGVIGACVFAADGTLVLDVDKLYDPLAGVSVDIQVLSPSVIVPRSSTTMGIVWYVGQVYARVGENRPYRSYGIWGAGQTTSDATDLWYTGDIMTGKIYVDAGSVNYRSWVRVHSIEIADTEPTDTMSTAASYFGSGKHYLVAEKLSSAPGVAQVAVDTAPGSLGTSNLFVWITAQKISSSNAWFNVPIGKVEAQVGQLEDLGGVGLDTGGAGINTSGSGVLHLQCNMPIVTTNGPCVKHGGAELRLNNVTLNSANTSAATNRPIWVTASGLMLNNCTLVAPAAAEAIGAGSAMTVSIKGHCMSTKTNSPNITLSPLGVFTIDSSVQ